MRTVTTILVIFQLLLRAVVVPHSHAEEGHREPNDHASRPHIHLTSHSHAHHAQRVHVHHHDDQRTRHELPTNENQTNTHDHDDDAIYVVVESLIATEDRVLIPQPSELVGFVSSCELGSPITLPRLVAYHAAGPPGANVESCFDLLPHLLRI